MMVRAICPVCSATIRWAPKSGGYAVTTTSQQIRLCKHAEGAGSCPDAERAADKAAALSRQANIRQRP